MKYRQNGIQKERKYEGTKEKRENMAATALHRLTNVMLSYNECTSNGEQNEKPRIIRGIWSPTWKLYQGTHFSNRIRGKT